VTVVIPTRNRPDLLRRAIRSALGQEGVVVRVVVVDEASDPPVDAGGDPRVQVVRHDPPRGVAAARNSGVAAVTTPYVAFCDDDDAWAPHKLRAQLDAMRETGRRWSYGDAVHVDEEGALLWLHSSDARGSGLARLLEGNCVPGGGSGVLAERSLVLEAGGFDPSYAKLADWEAWLRLARHAEPAVVARPLVAYTVSRHGMAHDVAGMEEELDRLLEATAEDRERLGVEFGWAQWNRYVAAMQRRKGARVAGVVRRARSVLQQDGIRAVVADLAGIARRRGREELQVPGLREALADQLAWVAEAVRIPPADEVVVERRREVA
jgi:hypothetical protein